MVIRRIEERDLKEVAVFEKEIAVISFGKEAMVDLQFHEKKLKKAMEKDREHMMVLEDEGILYGWLWSALQTNSVSNEQYINFKSFYIKDGPKEKQYSEKLMAACMEQSLAAGATRIIGRTAANNYPMRMVYKKFGFQPAFLTMEYLIEKENGDDHD